MRFLGSILYSAPSFRRPVGGLSPERLGFNPKLVHVGLVINKWHWERLFLEYVGFHLLVSFHSSVSNAV
jgi:hypothetical protein